MYIIRWILLRWLDYFKEISKCLYSELKRKRIFC
jgi:hypothetical protein